MSALHTPTCLGHRRHSHYMILLLPISAYVSYTIAKHRQRITSVQALATQLEQDNTHLQRAWEIHEDEIKLNDLLAEGAFDKVYAGTYGDLDVCIKVLKTVFKPTDKDLADFQQEVGFLQRTRHRHLIRFYGAGEMMQEGLRVPFLVLEYANRGSLASFAVGRSRSEPKPGVPMTLRLKLLTTCSRAWSISTAWVGM
eukprot:TRINITY_DN5635_c0_g1_i1.p1 TRINITY_DN5635_c0_g1~~TRINITY_DN5635_c0_g1_i1.p1  ORF type:complete len:197 (+),score=27.17 TRINITY_DN5635_c0_g1_i1:314-904(+)